jgi:predicted phage tail protein
MIATLREVRLYGELGRRFGRLHRLAVLTTAEAVQALCAVLPGFERAFLGPDGRAGYHVFVGRGERRSAITLRQAVDPVGRTEPIRIVPAIAGAKSGLVPILIGAILIYMSGGMAAAGMATEGTVGGMVASVGMNIGVALVVGGIIQVLSPQNRQGANANAQNTPSYNFDGPVNTTQEGLPVPLGYGRCITGSAVISAGLDTSDQVTADAPPTPPPVQDLPPEQPQYPWTDGGNGP